MAKRIDNLWGTALLTTVLYLLVWRERALYKTLDVDGLLAAAREQSRPRRWPWQPKTVRDRVSERSAELAALGALQGAALLKAVRQQSRPRRWPWQPKTVRDLVNERSAVLAELAAERSAELAEIVAQRKDALVEAARQQSRPRRWPWQPKTVRDRVGERSAELAELAAERSAELAALAAARRDVLLHQARRQSRPRRWPWQPKTVRDRLSERGAALKSVAADQLTSAAGQAQQVGPAVQEAAGRATSRLKDLAGQAAPALQEKADSATARVQKIAAAVPTAVGSATAAAGDSLKEAAGGFGKGVGDRASTVRAAAQAPVTAVSDSVHAGVRKVNHGVALFRTALWAFLIGVTIGILVSPKSGEEVRRLIRNLTARLFEAMPRAS